MKSTRSVGVRRSLCGTCHTEAMQAGIDLDVETASCTTTIAADVQNVTSILRVTKLRFLRLIKLLGLQIAWEML